MNPDNNDGKCIRRVEKHSSNADCVESKIRIEETIEEIVIQSIKKLFLQNKNIIMKEND